MRSWLVALAALALLCPRALRGQAANPCDLNADGKVSISDAQLAVNMAVGAIPCTATVMGAGVCSSEVVRRVVDAALSGTCVAGTRRRVVLSWTASTSSNVAGYHVYRGLQPGGPYTKLTTAPVAGTSYTDTAVQGGRTYYYVATAADNDRNESVYSNEASAAVPSQ